MEFATLGTAKALRQVRLAETGPSKIKIDNVRREKAAEEQIDNLRPKPKKRSKVDKLRDRIKANNMTKVPEHKKKVPPYIACIFTDKPITVKDFSELEQEGEDNYFAAKSQAFQDNFGSKVGVPRPIYVDFVGKVVKEYTAELEKKQQQKASIIVQKPGVMGSKDDSVLPSNSEKRERENQISSHKKRPGTAGSWKQKNRLAYGATSSEQDAKILSLPGLTGTERGRTTCRNEKRKVSYTNKGNARNKIKKKNSSGFSRSKSPQLLRKEALERQKERAILDKINEMEIRHRREDILRELRSRQVPWLLVVNHLARMKFWKTLYTAHIQPMRTREAHMKEANKLKHAIIFIEQWWFYKRIDMLIKRNPKAVVVLRGITRRLWCKHQLHKRARSVAQVGMFLKDAKGSDKVKKLYAYRHKVIKMQRHFRVWFYLKEARLQTLWRAMEVIGKARIESYYRAAKAAERRALKAMSVAAGFDTTLRYIDRMSKDIDDTLAIKEKEMKARQEESFVREHVYETVEKKRGPEKKMNISNHATGQKKMFGSQNEKSGNKSGTRSSKGKKPAIRWYFKMQMNPATKDKFEILRELLHKERHRHVLDLMEQAKRNSHVIATGGKPPEIDMSSLKAFLHAAPGSEEEENIILYEDEDTNGGLGKNEKKLAPTAKFTNFSAKHHMSKEVRPQAHTGDAAANHKIKHNSHHGYRAKVIHPRFNLFGYGILDYFRHCPLSFFEGVVDGYC